ncbi:MAG: tetratricopeptide repeat protein [Candidatus Neomarinimicrobiota bacterium]
MRLPKIILLMIAIPITLLPIEPDTTGTARKATQLYDLGITIEPARESTPFFGKGVANLSLVHLQNQLDSLSLAFSRFRADTDSLKAEQDSLKKLVVALQNRLFQSPYAPLSNPAKIYSRKDGQKYFQKGLDAFNHQNFLVAVDYFQKTMSADVSSEMIGDTYYWIGNCYVELGDDYLALEYFKKVVEYPLSEWLDDALFASAVIYQKTGETKLAEAFFTRLLKRFPSSPRAKLSELELKRLKQKE